MLRFLKPLGRIKALFSSKVVVKTVADAIGSMVPVFSLVCFFTLLFAIIGINLFGRRGLLQYKCGVPLTFENATYLIRTNAPASLNYVNCSVNMNSFSQFLATGDPSPESLRDLTVHGSDMICIEVTPATFCRCEKKDIDSVPFVCVELYSVCSGICFRGDDNVGISNLHTFQNFASASMSVIAFLYLKQWTDYMIAGIACAGAIYGYVYFFLLVIFGSFCLLNLTVATVSEAYSKVKKQAEIKRKRLDEENLAKERIEAERAEMKKQAQNSSREGEDGDSDEMMFDTPTAYKYWILGLLTGMPFLHRFYFKDWNNGKWFLLRIVTFNYVLVGWIFDGLTMKAINLANSGKEMERIHGLVEYLEGEMARIKEQRDSPGWKRNLIQIVSFPLLKQTPSHWSIEFLKSKIEDIEAEEQKSNHDQKNDDTSDSGRSSDLCTESMEEDNTSNEKDIEKKRKIQDVLAEYFSQSLFAWISDFVVVINAISMALQGFGPNLNKISTGVGFFATGYFLLESWVKVIAYGGFQYYIADGPNQLDFFLVVIPTFGELVCQITKSLLVTNFREDYIYPMLVLRALRVLRILKLTKHLKELKILATRAFGSPVVVIYAFLVTLTFIFIVALFGNQLFRKSTTFADARNDFQYILEAMKAMIEFLFGDRYFEGIDAGFEAADFVGICFFIIYFYIANFVILRIFIAIILENFEYSEEKKICLQIQLYQRFQIDSNDLINGA